MAYLAWIASEVVPQPAFRRGALYRRSLNPNEGQNHSSGMWAGRRIPIRRTPLRYFLSDGIMLTEMVDSRIVGYSEAIQIGTCGSVREVGWAYRTYPLLRHFLAIPILLRLYSRAIILILPWRQQKHHQRSASSAIFADPSPAPTHGPHAPPKVSNSSKSPPSPSSHGWFTPSAPAQAASARWTMKKSSTSVSPTGTPAKRSKKTAAASKPPQASPISR